VRYCDPHELKTLLAEAQAAGALSEELVQLLDRIVRGACSRWSPPEQRDDARQNCWLRLLHVWQRIDTTLPVFNFVTTLVRHECWLLARYEAVRCHESLDGLGCAHGLDGCTEACTRK
jgi:hypothetical protein